jgi:hypothetical protein
MVFRTIAIEFNSDEEGIIVTNATDEEIQILMTKFEGREDFIDDSYTSDEFFNFLDEEGIHFTQLSCAETTLYFDRSKQK